MDAFQANLVLDWYLELESRLSEVMKTVPYSNETMEIFLPPLANIIVDCGSLVDTVFRKCYRGSIPHNKLNITHYCQYYEPRIKLSSLRSLLFQTHFFL